MAGATPPSWARSSGGTQAFRSADTWGVLAQVALWAYAGFATLSGLLSLLGALGVHDGLMAITLISGLESWGLPVAATLFCVWIYRAYANLEPLGRPETAFSRWWAPASFFVPVVQVLYPYEIAKECWIHSDPPPTELPAGNDAAEYHFSVRPVIAWWLFCLAWFVVGLGHLMARSPVGASQEYAGYFVVSLALDCLTVAAAVYGIRVIREINRRQRKRYHALTSQGSPLGSSWTPS